MPSLIAPLRSPPLLFAHRGGRAHAPENTLEAFRNAVEMGATGLESDVWLTADGVPVLDHDGRVGRGLRRSTISSHRRDELPRHVPSLSDLYEHIPGVSDGTVQVCLDVKDPAAAAPVMALAANLGRCAELWLAHSDWRRVADWRRIDALVHLVDSTRMDRVSEGPERRAAASPLPAWMRSTCTPQSGPVASASCSTASASNVSPGMHSNLDRSPHSWIRGWTASSETMWTDSCRPPDSPEESPGQRPPRGARGRPAAIPGGTPVPRCQIRQPARRTDCPWSCPGCPP